jgi:iron complex transport system substrate-binding protein
MYKRIVLSTSPVSYYSISVKDATGQNVTFYSQPTRIVSLAPSVTQNLIALGLSRYIIGVDYYSSCF